MYWNEVLAVDDERSREQAEQFAVRRRIEQGPRHAAAQPSLLQRIGNVLLGSDTQPHEARLASHRPMTVRYERSVRPETIRETPRPVLQTAPVTLIVNPVVRSEAAPRPVEVSATDAASLFGVVSELLAETAIPEQSGSIVTPITAVDPMDRLEEVFDD